MMSDNQTEPIKDLVPPNPALEVPKTVTPFERFKEEGNALVKAAKYTEALEKYNDAWDACQTDDDRAMILNNRGVVHEKMGDTERALDIFKKALALKPEYIKVLFRRSLLHRKLQNYELAIEDLSDAQVLATKKHQHLVGLQDTVGQLIFEYAEYEIERVKASCKFGFPREPYILTYFRGFYCDPVSRIWKGLEQSPSEEYQNGQGDATKNIGFLTAIECMKSKEYSKISDHCTAEIDNSEGKYRMEALVLRGSFHFLSGNCSAALEDFQMVADDLNASKELKSSAHLKAGLCHNLWGNNEDAAMHFSEAELIWPQNGDVYYHAAVCLVDKGEAVPALALLGKGAEQCQDPSSCPLLHVLRLSIQTSYETLCECTGEDGGHSASDTLNKLNEMERSGAFDSPECYEMYGQALLLLSESGEEALAMFDKAIELSGGCKFYQLKKAMANIMREGNHEQALKTLEAFTEDLDIASIAYYHIGEIKMMMQKFDDGFAAIEKSIQLCHSIYDVKLRVMGKMDFKYHTRVAEKMKLHGISILAETEEEHKALE